VKAARGISLASIGAIAGLAAAQTQSPPPPGPVYVPEKPRYVVALEDGQLFAGPDVASREVETFRRGAIFPFVAEQTDAFGYDWTAVELGDSWRRTERWYVVPESDGGLEGTVSALTSVPAPPELPAVGFATSEAAVAFLALQKVPIAVTEDWFNAVTTIDAASVDRETDVLGLPAWRVDAEIAEELLDYLGGLEALGPFPDDAAAGRLFPDPRSGLWLRYDGRRWGLMSPPLANRETISLAANPQFRLDADAPPEATGGVVACWSLQGGLGPTGLAVGSVAAAPAAPARLAGAARPEGDFLRGYYDLGGRAWPTAVDGMLAPRRIVPPPQQAGVVLDDRSRRAAVYLEQVLSARLVERLRGTEVRVELIARAAPNPQGPATATVALDVEAGSLRQTLNLQVGALPTPLTLNFVVPEDASRLTIRVLPADLSIVVTEQGQAILDSLSLAPASWPARLGAAPLLLQRVRSVTYRASPRYTRATMAVSERTPEELASIWRRIGGAEVSDDRLAMVLAGEVEIGMTQLDVELAWGAAEDIEEGSLTRWHWLDRAASFDPAGLLVGWTRQPERPLPEPSFCDPDALPGGSP
jgi:hypothetical protein